MEARNLGQAFICLEKQSKVQKCKLLAKQDKHEDEDDRMNYLPGIRPHVTRAAFFSLSLL